MITALGFGTNSKTKMKHDMYTFLLHIKKLGFNCQVVLDCGAHQAWYSKMVNDVFPEAKLYLVEPLVEMETFLTDFTSRVQNSVYYPFGIGREKSEGYVTKSTSLSGSSTLEVPDEIKLLNGEQYQIDIWSIDELIKKKMIEIPDLIKLDIEGAELHALKGASIALKKTELLIVETSLYNFREYRPDFYQIVDFLYQNEYLLYDVLDFHYRPYDGALGMCDLAFAKKGGHLMKTNRW